MRSLLISLFILGGSLGAAKADTSLLGDWACESRALVETVNASVRFDPDGTYSADMMILIETGGDRLVAATQYRATFEVLGELLSETPEHAEITHMEVNGEATEEHAIGNMIIDALMRQGEPAKFTLTDDGENLRIYGNRSTIRCTRS